MAPASRLGRPRRASLRSASFIVHSPALTPSQRRGSGSQRGERCPTQGSAVSGVSAPVMRSASVRPARLVVDTPSPTYPPAQARPVARSRPTEECQSRGMPERAAPGVGEAGVRQLREELGQRLAQQRVHRRLARRRRRAIVEP